VICSPKYWRNASIVLVPLRVGCGARLRHKPWHCLQRGSWRAHRAT
jgi:hypothetical protein